MDKNVFWIIILTTHEVTDAFVDLMFIYLLQDVCTTYADHIFDNYIKGQLSMEILTHPINVNITKRTKNGAKIFYPGSNSLFYTQNPSALFLMFYEIFISIQVRI